MKKRLKSIRGCAVAVRANLCILSAHDRGNINTEAPSCCRLLGYWCDRDRYDARLIHADWNTQIRANSDRTPTDRF